MKEGSRLRTIILVFVGVIVACGVLAVLGSLLSNSDRASDGEPSARDTATEVRTDASMAEQVEVEVTRLVEVEVTRLVEVVVTATSEPTPEPSPTAEVDPTAYIVGSNMSPDDLPPGEEGLVVIATGPVSNFGVIPIVVRNNTGGPIYNVEISATARDAAGSVVGTGPGRDILPSYVAPGGVVFGRILFQDTPLDGATIEYLITGDDNPGFIFSRYDMEVVEHNLVGGSVVGILVNNHSTALGLTKANVICFDETLTPTTVRESFTDQDRVEAGGQLPFAVDLLGDEGECGRYLLTGSGLATD